MVKLWRSALLVMVVIVLNRAAPAADVPWAEVIKPPEGPAIKLPIRELPASDPASKVNAPTAQTLGIDWQVTGKYTVVNDDRLGRPVIELATPTRLSFQSAVSFRVEYVIEAWVRFHDDAPESVKGLATLRAGVVERSGKNSSSYALTVSRKGERSHSISPTIGDGSLWTQPLPELTTLKKLPSRWNLLVAERYPFARISPVWDEAYRTSIEQDMLALPREQQRWRRLRIEVTSDRVRMYHDGLLAFDEARGAITDGKVLLELTGPARLAVLKVSPWTAIDAQLPAFFPREGYVKVPRTTPDTRFEPVRLDDLCNAAGLVTSDSLPPADQLVTVNHIPLIFPPRSPTADHVDLSRSIYRHRMTADGSGGDPQTDWPPMSQLDPASLRVRVPRGAYRRLWVVAAADGEPNRVPTLTVRFFKPHKGWAIDAAAQVPLLTTQTDVDNALRLKVHRSDDQPGSAWSGSLWLVPIELDPAAQMAELRDELIYHLELTKEVKPYRAFPDPMLYGYFQAGLPSGVRVFAMTLERARFELVAQGNRTGNTYPFPEQPVWNVSVTNRERRSSTAQVLVTVTSPYGNQQTLRQLVNINPGETSHLSFKPQIAEYGLYRVVTMLPGSVLGDHHAQSREGTFLALPPDTRRATAKNTRWGLWVWNGAHSTIAEPAETAQLLRAYGSLVAGHMKSEDRTPWRLGPTAYLGFRDTPKWAFQDPHDPAEYARYSEECGLKMVEELKKHPDTQYVSIFAEHSISLRVTHGTPPDAVGKPWWDYTPEEQKSIRAHLIAAQAAFEGVRKHTPQVKFLFGHCGPMFSLPFMKQGYPKDWFDGYGVDCPQFERMPERPMRAVECNGMFFLNQEMKKQGYKKEIVHVESYYPSSHPLALGHRGSADSLVRTAALSLANGTDRFLACWTLDDCEGAWGSQHYGCIGLVSRRPEYNPKPAATAFATMTQMLDSCQFDGYVPTGSRSAYCLRFKETPAKHIYCLWTIRGTRPITVQMRAPATKAASEGELQLTDEHGNERPIELHTRQATLTLSPTPIWLTATKGVIERATVGEPRYVEKPGEHRVLLSDFERDAWTNQAEGNERYATNSWDMTRVLAPYQIAAADSAESKSRVLSVTLNPPTKDPVLTSFYRVLTPPKPLEIPGKAKAIGMWAKGNSGWGRVVYEIVDAKGEIFQSIGSKDEWNCDDIHSWSYFNYDGWRYLEFPLPNNSPGDNYREHDSVWWNHSADGIVDLPVKLTKLIVEMSSHQIYVNEILPVENPSVEFDDLQAVYDSAVNLTDEPVRIQRAAAGTVGRPSGNADGLPNPIAVLRENGAAPPTKIVRFYPPQHQYDGRRTHVVIEPVMGAKEYQIYVAAYADGRGAMPLAKSTELEPLVNRLRPGLPLHFFVTYTTADGKTSQPSAVATVTLKDEFLQK